MNGYMPYYNLLQNINGVQQHLQKIHFTKITEENILNLLKKYNLR